MHTYTYFFLGLHPGRTYKEPRFYYSKKSNIMINFLFVTRVWTPEIDKWLCKQEDVQDQKLDLIIMNSLLWDVNRWGPNGIDEYKKNLSKLLARVKTVLADDGMFIWLTAQPGSRELNSAAMETPGLEFQKTTTRFNVIQANFYTAHEVANAGYEVIDLHYYFLLQTFRRNRDGIHWSPEANRYVTNLVLTHISLANKIPLPNRNVTDYALKRVIYMSELAQEKLSEEDIKEKINELETIAQNMVRQGGPDEVQLPPLDHLNNNMMDRPNPYHNMGPQNMGRPMMPPMQQPPQPRPYPDPWLRGPGPNFRPPWGNPNFNRPGPPGPMQECWGPHQPHPGYQQRGMVNPFQQQQLPWGPPNAGPQPFGPDFRFGPNFRFN